MLLLMMTAFGVLALLLFAPDLPVSRLLHHWLVAEPVRLASTLTRTRLLFLGILLFLSVAGAEVILMLGSAEAVTAFAWQAAVYADAVTVSLFAGALAKARAVLTWLKARRTVRPRPRAVRRKRVSSSPRVRASNDDDPAPAMVPALAA